MADDRSPDPVPPSPPPRPKKRRNFLEPPPDIPLHKRPEFNRVFGLFLLLGVLVVFALMFGQTTPRALERVFSKPQEKSAAGSPEEASTPVDLAAEAEARRLAQAERRRRILTLFEGSLADAVDGSDFNESEGYRLMMRLLSQYSPEDVTRRVTGPLDYERALRDPDSLRGEFVRARGMCIRLTAVKLDVPIGSNTDIYRGFLSQADATEGLVFDLPLRPKEFTPGWREAPVDVEGIFYRTVRYETNRNKTVEVPYLLARNVFVVPAASSGTTGFLAGHSGWVSIALILVTLAASLVIYRFSRGRRRRGQLPPPVGFRQMFEKKIREERRNAHSEPPA